MRASLSLTAGLLLLGGCDPFGGEQTTRVGGSRAGAMAGVDMPSNEPNPPRNNGGGNNNGGGMRAGGGNGFGAQQAVRGAAKRGAGLNEMRNLQQLLSFHFNQNNFQLPPPNKIPDLVRRDVPVVAKAIEDGTIKMINTPRGKGIWGYTTTLNRGNHFVITATSVEELKPDELKQRLALQQ